MDQRSPIGRSVTLARPIHGACVVSGCWCGSTTASDRSPAGARQRRADSRTSRQVEAASTRLTGIALRSVGLPVV
jgi:hypothetical protein